MTGVELTEAEVDLIVVATALFGWAPQAEAMEAVQKVTAQIVAARLAAVEAERNEALRLLAPEGSRFVDHRDEGQIPECVDLLLSDDWDAFADEAWRTDFLHLAGHANSLVIRANGIRGAALVEALAKTRARAAKFEALVAKVRESASHPHKGPDDTDASMLRAAAKRLRGGYEPGGSHTKQTVANVITAVADLIDGGAS